MVVLSPETRKEGGTQFRGGEFSFGYDEFECLLVNRSRYVSLELRRKI